MHVAARWRSAATRQPALHWHNSLGRVGDDVAQDVPETHTHVEQLRFAFFVALDTMSAEERGGRSPHSITDWLMDTTPEGLAETRTLGADRAEELEPCLSIIEVYQELARRLWYIGRVHAVDRSLDWETRLLWDFTSAIVRDTYETTRAVVLLASQGIDAPAKVLLRHTMELYGRQLVVLRDPKQRTLYLRELRQLRDFQGEQTSDEVPESTYRVTGLSGGALMDRVASIEQSLDESSPASATQAAETARLLRDLYAYYSNLTHGGPELVDDVLYVYDPSFPSGQRRRAWGFGKLTRDGDLVLDHLTMLLWQFWRMVPRALETSGMADAIEGDVGVLLVAARGLERAVVSGYGESVFASSRAGGAES